MRAPTRLDDQRRPERPPHEYPEDAPFPSGQIFGFDWYPAGQRTRWWCRFLIATGQWFATFLDESDGDTELFGQGDTPREAFESLVGRWLLLNGGVASPALHQHLVLMRGVLSEHGL